MDSPKKRCIISLDGLSLADFEVLTARADMGLLCNERRNLCRLDSKLLSSAQSAWAEILTGTRWYLNGCVGYALPGSTLNRLHVTTERNLETPVALFDDDADRPAVIINMPLLAPKSRLWLSDGSLPISKIVSPNSLKEQSDFSQYLPRPTPNLAVHNVNDELVAETMLTVEERRLEYAQQLFFNETWSTFIYRVTVFDVLYHLFGLNYLRASDLAVFSLVEQFLARLVAFLQRVSSRDDVDFVILSAYSHISCRGVVNINSALQSGGFLQLDENARTNLTRGQRIRAANRVLADDATDSMLASMEGCLVPELTLAASPVKGAVFINAEGTFDDGCVSSDQYGQVREQVKVFCMNWLERLFGRNYHFEENPNSLSSKSKAPAFVMYVEGVEFHNMMESKLRGYNIPRTMHAPGGFAVLPERFYVGDSLPLSQLSGVLNGNEN